MFNRENKNSMFRRGVCLSQIWLEIEDDTSRCVAFHSEINCEKWAHANTSPSESPNV